MLRSQVEVHILDVYQGPHLFQNRRDRPQCLTPPAIVIPGSLGLCAGWLHSEGFLTSSYRFPGDKLSREPEPCEALRELPKGDL